MAPSSGRFFEFSTKPHGGDYIFSLLVRPNPDPKSVPFVHIGGELPGGAMPDSGKIESLPRKATITKLQMHGGEVAVHDAANDMPPGAWQAAVLATTGLSNRAIGAICGITEDGAKTRIATALQKISPWRPSALANRHNLAQRFLQYYRYEIISPALPLLLKNEREEDVLVGIAGGLDDEKIGQGFSLSTDTIKGIMRDIRRRNRIPAAAGRAYIGTVALMSGQVKLPFS